MRILSWNLNGLFARIRNGNLQQLEKFYPPDIFCFQEIKTHDRPDILPGYYHFWNPAVRLQYSGVLTLTKEKPQNVIYGIESSIPEDQDLNAEGRVLTVDTGRYYIVNTYAPRSQNSPARRAFRCRWDASYYSFLKKLAQDKPVIACGDFNATLSPADIYAENERMNLQEQMDMTDERSHIKELLDHGFTDTYRYLHPSARDCFTWWSNRRNKRSENRGWRLDYFFISDPILEDVRDTFICRDIKGSDHSPIVLDLEGGSESRSAIHFIGSETVGNSSYVKTDFRQGNNSNEESCYSSTSDRNHLSSRWAKRTEHFDMYREKLEALQGEISVYAGLQDWKKVNELQIELISDIRFRCLAVNRVVQAGGQCGVDHVRWKTDAQMMEAADQLEWKNYQADPQRIIKIVAKNTGKVRYTSVFTWRDRAMSLLMAWAFKPVEEAHADRCSFAFRPGRSRQDAIMGVSSLFAGRDAPEYFLCTDVKGYYASIQHRWLMNHVPLVKPLLKTFLEAGHIFSGELFSASPIGISEGNSLSPDIGNFTLDGLQKAIYKGIHGKSHGIDYADGAIMRYADDVVVAVRRPEHADIAMDVIRKFIAERGLVLSEEKTKYGHIVDGLESIGYLVRKEASGMVIRPKPSAVQRFKCGIHDFILNWKRSQRDMISELNKKLTGWAGQYRSCDAYDSYLEIDLAVEESLLEAAISRHPDAERQKLIHHYWYKDSQGKYWYTLPDDRSFRVIHLADTHLTAPRRGHTDVNPYLQKNLIISRKKAEDIQKSNGAYRTVWERAEGKCLYCGRPLLPDQPKTLVTVDLSKREKLSNKAYVHSMCVQNDFQYLQTLEDIDGISEYNVLEMLNRINENSTVIYDRSINEHWKYFKLYEYFGTCTKPHFVLTFRQIEDILGFRLPESFCTFYTKWYRRKDTRMIAEAWALQGYRLKRLSLKKRKAEFEAMFDHAEYVEIPKEITDHRIPLEAKNEIEHFLDSVVKKYGLSDEDIVPTSRKGSGSK